MANVPFTAFQLGLCHPRARFGMCDSNGISSLPPSLPIRLISPPFLSGSFEGLHKVAENTPASCLPVAVGNRAGKADGPSRGERVVTSVGRRHRFRVNSFAKGSWKLTLAHSPSLVPGAARLFPSPPQSQRINNKNLLAAEEDKQ